MKGKKEHSEKPSPGTITSAKYRARCNKLTDTEREELGEEFLKLYYADKSARQSTRRR